MDTTSLLSLLAEAVPGAPYEPLDAVDQPAILVARDHLIETVRVLRDHPDLQFIVLAELTALDWWPREPRFEMVYLFASIGVSLTGAAVTPKRLRVKVRLPGTDAVVPTLSGEWACADWLEREVWDLYGIVFEGHPDLRRLLMPDDWEGHPLRKDYPVQVKVPVATQQSLQLTQEEFIANMQAARQRSPGAR
jgi:NADH-quinone oxidoreductase subunit C